MNANVITTASHTAKIPISLEGESWLTATAAKNKNLKSEQSIPDDGIMVIPVGPPGAQHVIKAVKEKAADGAIRVARSDIYGGAVIPFVPFTGSHQP